MKKILLIATAIVLGLQVSTAQNVRRSDRKITEIKKIITISPAQEERLRNAYEAYQALNDSVLYQVQDANVAAQLTYAANKKWQQTLMKTLTEEQRNQYIRVTAAPEVQAKAAAKVETLKESGSYTQAQLDSAQTQIFEYLMLEKVVYARDKYDYRKQKYDYRKQKENIAQLKKRQPARMRQADTQEKARIERKHYQGRTEW